MSEPKLFKGALHYLYAYNLQQLYLFTPKSIKITDKKYLKWKERMKL